MKKVVILLLLVIGGFEIKSQNASGKLIDDTAIPTNAQRFKLDYEIKGWDGIIKDAEKINLLNLDYFDSKRKEKDDSEEYDATTGLTVIVYSVKKTQANKPQ